MDSNESMVVFDESGDDDASISLPKCIVVWAGGKVVLVPVAAVVLVINFFNLRAIVVLCH